MELGASVKWVEGESNNTAENALLSARMLKASGVPRIYLVTHAWHMPRAKAAFERAGLQVIPAATAYSARLPLRLPAFVPSAQALLDSSYFFHEIVGTVWYRLKSGADRPNPVESS